MQRDVQPPRLLVVDSEDIVRVLIARMLRDQAYDVVEAANGRVALELLGATPPQHFDVVITNSRLPGLSGYDFVTEMLARYPHLHVIHVSGHPQALDDPRFDRLERVTTVPKPFTATALGAVVERCLRATRSAAKQDRRSGGVVVQPPV